MDQLSDEEVEVREGEDEEEEDSDKDDQDLDKMFGAWLGELDKLTQVLICIFRVSSTSYTRVFHVLCFNRDTHTFIFSLSLSNPESG